MESGVRSKIAVIGSGISGLSAAWLLSQRHEITLFEKDWRAGGHSRTIEVDLPGMGSVPVDTGFIVFNEATYPNLTALFDRLGVATKRSDMSFAVSLDGGAFEYSGGARLKGLFAQRSNLVSPRFWSMIRDLVRFYREAPAHAGKLGLATLGEFLASGKYGPAFRDDHLLPMAAAIWSAPCHSILDYPAESFIRFCENHGLLQISRRPRWRTVEGGARAYVEKMLGRMNGRVQLGRGAVRVVRHPDGVWIHDTDGGAELFDKIVIATHADQALGLLADPTPAEASLLGCFRYSRNSAILHDDPALMPRRRKAWSSWNYLGQRVPGGGTNGLCVSYWMNRLQGIDHPRPLIMTLNANREPTPGSIIDATEFDHPLFDNAAMTAQRDFWPIQGENRTYYCGAWLGAGFHEDGLQAGLAVAEAIGAQRPWQLAEPNGRIHVTSPLLARAA
jgi:predicted NAD/FAD-binding protein